VEIFTQEFPSHPKEVPNPGLFSSSSQLTEYMLQTYQGLLEIRKKHIQKEMLKMTTSLVNKASILLIAISILAAAVMPIASVLAFNPDPNVLDIDGSTTLFPISRVSLTQFPIAFAGTTINLYSTGSGHGQQSLANAYVDIGNSSSNCSGTKYVPTSGGFTVASYVNTATLAPYQCGDFVDNIIARDGLSVIVHQSKLACITNITRDQIGQIYRGVITNWDQLGCPSATLTPRARIVGSGTRASFIELLGSSRLTDAQEQATINATGLARAVENTDLELFIAQNPDHFGYGGIINVDPLVKSLSIEGVAPTVANVQNGTYLFSRNLHMYTLPTSVNNKARITDYINWILSPTGQAVVENVGYIPVGTAAPDWDVNVDRVASVLDLTSIGGYWAQFGPLTGDPAPLPIYVRGWVRADVNFDGQVSVLDLTTVGGNWAATW
jgi:phosphate transport system substrate-binding protein